MLRTKNRSWHKKTSYNLRGGPIVCTPEEAIDCFKRSVVDRLVIGSFIAVKTEEENE